MIVGREGQIEDLHLKAPPGTTTVLMSWISDALKKWKVPPPNDGGMAVLRLVL